MTTLDRVLTSVALVALIYSLFAFICANLNIADWGVGWRFTCGMAMVAGVIATWTRRNWG